MRCLLCLFLVETPLPAPRRLLLSRPSLQLSAATLDSLATFETSREDLEDGGDHELVNEDRDDSDLEPVDEDGTNHGHEPY